MDSKNTSGSKLKVVNIGQRTEANKVEGLSFEKDHRIALYVRLADELKTQILQGTFKAGQKLPSFRALASAKNVSINTVQEAYRFLEDNNWIVVRSQSGAYVEKKLPEVKYSDELSNSVVRRNISSTGQASILTYREDLIPLGAAIPDESFFPCQKLAHGMANLLRKKPKLIGNYNFAPGSLELRQQIARRVIAWGATVDPRRVTITNGAVEGLLLCLRVVTKPGDLVAIESPGFYGFFQLIESLGLRALHIENDPGKGFNVESFERHAAEKKIAAVMLSTTVSNPTGSTMSLERKRELVKVATRYQIPVIEDATFADLNFKGDRQAAQGFDTHGLVMLCASLTKTAAPGVRIGWVDGGRFSEQICFLKRVSSIGQSELMELALAEYLSNGGMDSHLRRIRKAMQGRVYSVAETVGKTFPPGTRFSLPSGGFLLWVELPEGIDGIELQEKAATLGIGVAPGALFSLDGRYRNYIRLNCAIANQSRATEGLLRLSALINSMMDI
ncbi:PLP-dependent aminotransferase family protein [Pseudomonas moorei]|nr:PLP-dependent aminotransferase family protein [Pseudomonas moorei]